MIGDEDRGDETDEGPRFVRYEQEVEAHFRPGEAVVDTDGQVSGEDAAARRRKAALSWLLFLVVIVGLVLLCWPKIAPLMHKSVAPTTPPHLAGAPTPPLQAAAPQARPKRPVRDYPPCTATRTGSCIQQDGNNP